MDSTRARPIDSLPDEILTQIFALACPMHISTWSALGLIPQPSTNNPVILTHVCSYWRRVAIAFSGLWACIYLDPDHFHYGQVPPRVETYLARASDQSLDVYVINSPHSILTTAAQHGFIQFIASISPRTWRMMVDVPDGLHDMDLCQRIIHTILKNCVPGTLRQLTIQVITMSLSRRTSQAPPEDLEPTVELLGLPITALRLHDYFPKWTSQMYHALTELRLGGPRGSISESALVAMLRLSPKLRVLEIDIKITDVTQTHDTVTPMLLADLEVLIPGNCSSRGQIHLLRMIRPGPKPLTLLMGAPLIRAIVKSPDDTAIKRFFASSNVTRLIIKEPRNYTDVAILLALTPMVRALALVAPFNPEIVEDESVLLPTCTVEALYATDPLAALPLLERIIQRHGVRKLTLWGMSEMGAVVDQLSPICPQITTLSREEQNNPIREWI